MTSIRQQVFRFIKGRPGISVGEVIKEFRDSPTNTIRTYYKQHISISKNVSIDIKEELKKIIKDYKQPASARVQAIREYNNLVENKEESSDDSLLTLYKMVENDT